jgi:hypothetical protein
MKYVLMIATDELAEASDADEAAMMTEYEKFMADEAVTGALRGGERLRPTSASTTVRVRNGEVLTTDGPFAETKEQVGGYFVVEVADLDAAIDIAAKIPGAKHGSIEVRPIWEM